ncbi:Fic family protein [Roseibium marinum]|uniref:Fic/DOC family protein n=1 Tax=Roseibium marinum TaxID=281252 RepID=A0A2S3UXI5_9HYPH|nr:Fic family protein [Roseibium marinum]POF32300.1 Fic/DOC family protein [Roseibium marinum]
MTRRISESEFKAALNADRSFALYARTTGKYANHFASEAWKTMANLPSEFENAEEKQRKLQEIVQKTSRRMAREQDKLSRTRRQTMGIYGKALNGCLARDLAQPHNQMPPASYNAGTNMEEAAKAAKWVAHASGSMDHLGCPVTEHDIETAIRQIAAKRQMFSAETVTYVRKKTYFGPRPSMASRALATLKYLRPRLPRRATPFTDADFENIGRPTTSYQTSPNSAVRWAEADDAYPGTISGQYFLYNFVFPKAQTLSAQLSQERDSGQRGPSALDLACFVLGAFIATHPFKDGNGRTARVLYAGVLLAHREPFVAPAMAMEKRLHGLRSTPVPANLPPIDHFDFADTL